MKEKKIIMLIQMHLINRKKKKIFIIKLNTIKIFPIQKK